MYITNPDSLGNQLNVPKRTELEPKENDESLASIPEMIALFDQAAKEHPKLFVKRSRKDEWKVRPQLKLHHSL